jgi:hypothetical protein
MLLGRYRTLTWIGYERCCQVLAYADELKLIADDFRAIDKNADVLLNACKDIGLAVNLEELSI